MPFQPKQTEGLIPSGLHQALHPLPARNEWGEDRGGETNKNAPPLPSPLLHAMEEREELDAALLMPWIPFLSIHPLYPPQCCYRGRGHPPQAYAARVAGFC